MILNSKDEIERYNNFFKNKGGNTDLLTKPTYAEETIKLANQRLMLDETKQKLDLRNSIFNFVKGLIIAQLVFFNIITLYALCVVSLNVDWFIELDNEMIANLLEFLKYFIGATIVELLGMLGFVLQFAFHRKK